MASPGEREADRVRMTVISEGLLQEQTSKDDSAKNFEQSPLCDACQREGLGQHQEDDQQTGQRIGGRDLATEAAQHGLLLFAIAVVT